MPRCRQPTIHGTGINLQLPKGCRDWETERVRRLDYDVKKGMKQKIRDKKRERDRERESTVGNKITTSVAVLQECGRDVENRA
jgi:hypothetical protein